MSLQEVFCVRAREQAASRVGTPLLGLLSNAALIGLPAALFFSAAYPHNVLLLLTYEMVAQLGLCTLLVFYARREPGWIRRRGMLSLCISAFAFVGAELGMNGSLVAGSITAYHTVYYASFLYTITFVGLAIAIWRHFSWKDEPWLARGCALMLGAAHFLLQYYFILNRLGPSYFAHLPAIVEPNSYVYSAATSAVVTLAALSSLRTQDEETQFWLQSILALLAFDFAQRFQIVQNGFARVSFAQALWAMAVGALSIASWRCASKSRGVFARTCDLAPWFSARVLLGAFVFAGNTVLFVVAFATHLLHVENAAQVTVLLASLFATWWLSNVLASRISRSLVALAAALPTPAIRELNADEWGQLELRPVVGSKILSEAGALLGHYNRLLVGMNDLVGVLLKRNREAAVGRMAAQVAHDIRSPLAALRMAMVVPQFTEETRSLVRGAIFRIEDIANMLLAQKSGNVAVNSAIEAVLVSSVVESLISEKRCEFRARLNVHIESRMAHAAYGLFVAVPVAEFKRIVSNLINNAVEALPRDVGGRVTLDVCGDAETVCLEVRDDGCGMAPDVLRRLGQEDLSVGKPNGHGLGVYHARQTVSQWGGELTFASEVGDGTVVRLTVRRIVPPTWFLDAIRLSDISQVVILDDDSSIHQVWRERLGTVSDAPLVNLATPDDLRCWLRQNDTVGALFLVDHEFVGWEQTGLELVEQFNLVKHSVLVTSRFEEKKVVRDVERLGVRMLPKSAAPYIPIIGRGSMELPSPDLVLIDDDPLVHTLWGAQAAWRGQRLRAYSHFDAFLAEASRIAKSVPIYIDSQLGGDVPGEERVSEIYRLGFGTIFLTTGREDRDFSTVRFLTGVIGKGGPFESASLHR